MIVFPNAKINIGLRIVERRPDGYHNIESIMVPVGWCDILEIVPSETGRVWNIAKKQLGDGSRWKEIYELNIFFFFVFIKT